MSVQCPATTEGVNDAGSDKRKSDSSEVTHNHIITKERMLAIVVLYYYI